MRSLVLDEGDGVLFEKIYSIAMQLTDPQKAAELSGIPHGDNPLDRYWQNAFCEAGGGDKQLTSAILSALEVPFGAYQLTKRTPESLEITPWILSDAKRIEYISNQLESPDPDISVFRGIARSISLTADFLVWLDKFTKTESKRG